MYFVLKSAIYDHGTFLITESLPKAIAFADECARADFDDHHTWYVMKYAEAAKETGGVGMFREKNRFVYQVDNTSVQENDHE